VGRWLVRLAAGAVVALAVVTTVFLVGMRTKSPAVVDRVRRFNRAVTNPRVLRTAGSPGASASGDPPPRPGVGPACTTRRWVPSPSVMAL
jgi:hypothetical protein